MLTLTSARPDTLFMWASYLAFHRIICFQKMIKIWIKEAIFLFFAEEFYWTQKDKILSKLSKFQCLFALSKVKKQNPSIKDFDLFYDKKYN